MYLQRIGENLMPLFLKNSLTSSYNRSRGPVTVLLDRSKIENSFSSKISKLTSPKTVWLIVSLKIFDEDRPRVVELIGGGLTRQAIYKYVKYYNELDPRLEEHKQIKQNIELIFKTYERKLV